ncbi:hypothetical protein MHH60_17330 [Paenibacillus sp. FSL H7-0716]|nr:hypothetical protein [Paenibacillus odorifer]
MADSKDPFLLDFPESFETEKLLIRAPGFCSSITPTRRIRES